MPVPQTASQAAKWRDAAIDAKLTAWVGAVALPTLQKPADKTAVAVVLPVEGTDLFIDYDAVARG